MELISKLASLGKFAPGPREAERDDLDERDARERANRAVLDVLDGARTVDAACDNAAGVEWMGDAK